MIYDYKKYQLNSLRTGFITENKLFGKINIFFNCASQCPDIFKIKIYNKLFNSKNYNLILLPINLNGHEPGDDYEIYHYYENILETKFTICEKLEVNHIFFNDFGIPNINFENYIFDQKLNFIKKTQNISEFVDV
jgi:glutathione peroxidase-family protein